MKFVFDLDGTICFQGVPVSENILSSLESLIDKGHEVIFASARPIRDLLPILHKRFHHYPMVGGNGSMVANNGKVISSVNFNEETLCKMKGIIEKYNATYLIDGPWDYSYTGPSNHPILKNLDPLNLAKNVPLEKLNPIVKAVILTSSDFDKVKEELSKLDVVINVHGNEKILDISPKGINKWTGLQQLGVKDKEFIAFGNDANDISMFEHSYHSVMIGDYTLLEPYASESLPVNEKIEEKIIDKLEEHSKLNKLKLI